MAASYPSSVRVFTTKTNVSDIIDASHPNFIQEEVVAIESTLGASPQVSTTPSPSGSFTATSTSFATVSARLANVETGVVADSHSQYIRKAGDSANVITAGSASTKPLILKGASSQSANLQEWQNSSSTVLASVDASGNLTATTVAAGVPVNTSAKTAAYTLATTDYNTLIQMNGAFAFTVGTGLSAAPVGTQIHLLALTSGVSVTASGTTVNGTPGLKLRTAYSSATLICLGTNNWVLIGDLSA